MTRLGSPRSDRNFTVSFSPVRVNRVIKALLGTSKTATRRSWLAAVANLVCHKRPDLAEQLVEVLGVKPAPTKPPATGPQNEGILSGLTIGEIGVCYEALLSRLDRDSRRTSGQFFTPDDAAHFMAEQSLAFPKGTWLDPCCGVGNLAWHLASVSADPAEFIKNRLLLIDQDATALRTAVALIAAGFAAPGDTNAVKALATRATRRDFLSREAPPAHDFVVFNPPYARAPKRTDVETGSCHDLFAYFTERVAKTSRGFIGVTPASYLAAPKFQPLRDVLNRYAKGGDVLVFDNVPDTLFRGYKYGSANTSKTNFVRAAITICSPKASSWRVTPILRWQVADRETMFDQCRKLLVDRRIGPDGEWVKVLAEMTPTWDYLARQTLTVGDLTTTRETRFALDVPLTPRYYISASFQPLNRGSKARLYFENEADRDRAAVVLNSSAAYLWWRGLDGGVTLPKRVLRSTPVPPITGNLEALVGAIRESEANSLVGKMNAGRLNENIKHPLEVVRLLNDAVIPDASRAGLGAVYSNNMFPLK